MIAELFQTTAPNTGMRLRNICDQCEVPAEIRTEATLQRFLTVRREGELDPKATHKESLSVRQEGARQVAKATSRAKKERGAE